MTERPRGRPLLATRRFVEKTGMWHRVCRDCGNELAETPQNFYLRSGSETFMNRCKDCFSAYVRARKRASVNKNESLQTPIELFMVRLASYYGEYVPTNMCPWDNPFDQFANSNDVERFLHRDGDQIVCDLTGMPLNLQSRNALRVYNRIGVERSSLDKKRKRKPFYWGRFGYDYPWLVRIDPTLPWLRTNTAIVAYWVFELLAMFGGGEEIYEVAKKIGTSFKENPFLFKAIKWPQQYVPWRELIRLDEFNATQGRDKWVVDKSGDLVNEGNMKTLEELLKEDW